MGWVVWSWRGGGVGGGGRGGRLVGRGDEVGGGRGGRRGRGAGGVFSGGWGPGVGGGGGGCPDASKSVRQANGGIRWNSRWVNVSTVCVGDMGLEECEGGTFLGRWRVPEERHMELRRDGDPGSFFSRRYGSATERLSCFLDRTTRCPLPVKALESRYHSYGRSALRDEPSGIQASVVPPPEAGERGGGRGVRVPGGGRGGGGGEADPEAAGQGCHAGFRLRAGRLACAGCVRGGGAGEGTADGSWPA